MRKRSKKGGGEEGGLGRRVWSLGLRVQGSGFRVRGSGSRVQGSGFRVQESVGQMVDKFASRVWCQLAAPESSLFAGETGYCFPLSSEKGTPEMV